MGMQFSPYHPLSFGTTTFNFNKNKAHKALNRMKTLTTFLALSVATGLAICHANDDWVDFAANGKKIHVHVDSIPSIESGFSVVYSVEGKDTRLNSQSPAVEEQKTTSQTPFGEAKVSTITYGEKGSPYQLTIVVKRLESLNAFTVQGIFHNRSAKNVNLKTFDLLDTSKAAGGAFAVENAADWLVTPLMESTEAKSLAETNKTFNEAALFYNSKNHGFLIGPVGPAEAFTSLHVADGNVTATALMDGVLVRAGESRRSEEMVFCFEPSRTAVDIWTRWVAITHKARLNKGPVYGWCSWYDRTTNINEEHTLEVADILSKNPNVFGKGILQIDDGYQKMDGDWSGNDKFPSGLAAVAKKIRDIGWIPGVWFAPLMINPSHPWMKANPDAIQKNAEGISSFQNPNPFHPDGANWIVPDHPESKKFLFNIIKDTRDRGYGYIKIDFNGIGSRFYDPTKTRLQIFRELYTLYREAAGDEMYMLSCLGQPTRGVIGFIDAARVGPDSHPAHFKMCLESVLRFQIYDNVWWQNDPDVSYLATGLPSRVLGPTPEGEGMWRTWHAITSLVGGTAMVSEPLQTEDCKAMWRNFEIMRPSSAEPARLLTLGHSAENTTFGFDASRPYGDFSVYNLYNVGKGKKAIHLDFKETGLPANVDCMVFDFWENKVIATVKGSYDTVPLDEHASALLRFTPLAGNDPVLVGSNLHLSIGATEIKDIRTSPETLEIYFTEAGAQEGSLIFFSKKTLSAQEAKNCKIQSVEAAGKNLWKVNIAGREMGKPQSISLAIAPSKATQSQQ